MDELIIILVSVFMLSGTDVNQPRKVNRSFRMNQNESVKLDLKFGKSITINSWSKNKVAFKAVIEINKGALNDALEINFKHENDQLSITSDYDKEKISDSQAPDCSGEGYSKYSVSGKNGNYSVCAHITYQIFVPRKADLNVKTINANITLTDLGGPVWVKSISGFVDASWPQKAPADVELKTISGEIYTDFDLSLSNRHHSYVGEHVQGKIYEGGPQLTLRSVSGNIYLRKADP